jgi:very-short-patch-repair endonuclease
MHSLPSVLTRRQALAAGLSDHAIRHRLRTGRWQALLRGVYLTASGTPTADQRQVAALAYVGAGSMLTGLSALARHGIRAAGQPPQVHVLAPDHLRTRSSRFVLVTRTTRPPDPPDHVDGMVVAPVGRAVVDACLRLNYMNQVRAIVAEPVQRWLCSVADIADWFESAPSRGSALLRRALEEVQLGAHSAAEAQTARVLRLAGIPSFEQNADVHAENGAWLARGDFVWRAQRAILEVDSVAYHLSPGDQRRTQQRHNRLQAAGWAVVHYPPAMIRDDPETIVAEVRAFLAHRVGLISGGPLTA